MNNPFNFINFDKNGVSSPAVSGGKPVSWNAVGNFIGNRWDEYTGKTQQSEQNKFNQQQADIAYAREIEMVDKANAYNSPKSQMERFSEAGLNPNLIYGQGTPGNQTVIPRYQQVKSERRPNVDYLGMITKVLGMFADLNQKHAQTDNLRAMAELNKTMKSLRTQELSNISKLFPNQLEAAILANRLKAQEITRAVYENAYREKGVNPNDPLPYRLISKLIDETGLLEKLGLKKQAKTTFGTTGERPTWFNPNDQPLFSEQ